MDPKKHPLTIVAELLEELRPARPGMYNLHAYRGDLDCCRCELAPKDAFSIAKITSADVNNGLTTEMWNRIEAQIRIFTKQGVLEWQAPKP